MDEFDTFNAPKRALLAAMLPVADVTVCLCCDGEQDTAGGMGLFSGVQRVIAGLKRMAADANVPTRAVVLTEDKRHAGVPALAELNLLLALIHYVCNLKDANGNLLPIEQRDLGTSTTCWQKRASTTSTASWPNSPRTTLPKGTTAYSSKRGKICGATSPSVWAIGWRSFKTIWWTQSPATMT